MVEYQLQDIDSVFHALSNPTRRSIITELTKGDLTVKQLAAKYDMTPQAVSKHIKVLVNTGLLLQERHGKEKQCKVNIKKIELISNLISHWTRFWESRLDALEEYFLKENE